MDLDLYDLNIWQKLWNESTLILKSRFANIDTVVYVVLFWRKRTTRVSMSAENKERLCGDNINDRSVCVAKQGYPFSKYTYRINASMY